MKFADLCEAATYVYQGKEATFPAALLGQRTAIMCPHVILDNPEIPMTLEYAVFECWRDREGDLTKRTIDVRVNPNFDNCTHSPVGVVVEGLISEQVWRTHSASLLR